MLIFILTLLLSFTGSVESGHSSIAGISRSQADHYLQAIQRRHQPDLHYWALSQLAKANDSLASYIRQQIRSDERTNPYFKSFLGVQNPHPIDTSYSSYQQRIARGVIRSGSDKLFLDLLLTIKDVQQRKQIYRQLRAAITSSHARKSPTSFPYEPILNRVASGDTLNRQQLPYSNLSFAHFIIRKRYTDHTFLSQFYFKKAAEKWRKYIDPLINAKPSLQNSLHMGLLIMTYYEVGDKNTIYQLLDPFLQDKYFPNSSLKIGILKILDYATYYLGYNQVALSMLRNHSLPLVRFLGERAAERRFMEHKGIFLYRLGMLNKAQATYQQVLDKFKGRIDDRSRIGLFNNLSLTYYKTGRYDRYIDYQTKILEMAKNLGIYQYQLEIYRNLHIYHRRYRNWNTARRYLEKAQALARKHGKPRDLASVYTTTAIYYKKYDSDYEKAASFLDKADALVSAQNNYNQYIKILSERGKLYRDQKKFHKAIRVFKKLSNIIGEKKDTRNYLNAQIRIANMELQLNRYDRARKRIQHIQSYDLDVLDFELLTKLESIEARLLFQEGKQERAIDIIKTTVNQIIQRAQNSSDLRSGYWHLEPEYMDVLKTGVDLLLRDGRDREALIMLDRIKTINDAEIYKNPLVKSKKMADRELAREQQINEKLNQLRKEYLNAGPERKLELQSKISRLKAQRNQLYENFARMEDLESIPSIRYIQKQLPYDQLILHVTQLKDTYYFGYITNNSYKVRRLPLNRQLHQLFQSAFDHTIKSETNLNELYSIYNLLRLYNLPKYITRITVIPGGYLYQLPLEILPVSEPDHSYSYGSTRYFIEEYQINYYTSLEEYSGSNQTTTSKLDFLGFGVTDFGRSSESLIPLPFADQEVKQIYRQLSNLENKKIFVNQQATEKKFKQYANQSRIIHLATHSTVNNQEPQFSSFYLLEDTDSTHKNQNRIFAYELFGLNLDTQLIMLNSCKSGSGPHLQGSGIMGISRSLKYAGSSSLVLNLWSVNDKFAADFATQFYHYLNQGLSKAAAMRKAKLHFLSNNNANPHYWGPYMLLGNPAPIVHNQFRFMRLLTIGSFMTFILLSLSIVFRKRHR